MTPLVFYLTARLLYSTLFHKDLCVVSCRFVSEFGGPPTPPAVPRWLLALVLAVPAAAAAQPALRSEASAGQEAYGYGEPITVRYTVRNDGDEGTALWGSSSCPVGLAFGTLVTPGEGGGCTADEAPVPVGAGGSVTWVWVLDPAEVGAPEADGEQTVRAYVNGRCGGTAADAGPACRLEATATFTAPRYLGGPLWVVYATDAADSLAVLKRTYRATVTDSTTAFGRTSERWVVDGVPLVETAIALNLNGFVDQASPARAVYPTDRLATAVDGPPGAAPPLVTAPAPNPATTTATFTVEVAEAGPVTVDLVDVLGRRVLVLHDGPLAGGAAHRFRLQAGSLPAGSYVVRVAGGGAVETRRVVVAR